jgi:hypothetical protein
MKVLFSVEKSEVREEMSIRKGWCGSEAAPRILEKRNQLMRKNLTHLQPVLLFKDSSP